MANIANVVTVGPFTTFLKATVNLIDSAMRVRIPKVQPADSSAGGELKAEVSSPF